MPEADVAADPEEVQRLRKQLRDTTDQWMNAGDVARRLREDVGRIGTKLVQVRKILGANKDEDTAVVAQRLVDKAKVTETARLELAVRASESQGSVAVLNERISGLMLERAHLRQELERAQEKLVDQRTELLQREAEIRELKRGGT